MFFAKLCTYLLCSNALKDPRVITTCGYSFTLQVALQFGLLHEPSKHLINLMILCWIVFRSSIFEKLDSIPLDFCVELNFAILFTIRALFIFQYDHIHSNTSRITLWLHSPYSISGHSLLHDSPSMSCHWHNSCHVS